MDLPTYAWVHRGCPAQSFAKQVPATAPLRTFVSGAAQGFEVSGQSVALQSLAARWVACGDGMVNQSESNGSSLARTSSSTCTGALQMKRDPRCSHETLRNSAKFPALPVVGYENSNHDPAALSDRQCTDQSADFRSVSPRWGGRVEIGFVRY